MARARLAVVAALTAVMAAAGCSGSGGTSKAEPTPAASGGGTSRADAATSSAPSQPAPFTPALWPTYQHDAGRSGVDASAPAAGTVTKAWTSATLDGTVYAEPLVVGDRVIAATEGDSVYALATATGSVLWATKLGTPMDGSALPCGDIDPSGITGTPVIDAVAGLVWVVAFVRPGHHDLVAVDLKTGQVRSRRAADPSGANPLEEQQRSALTLAGGVVYVPYGGLFGDCGGYHGIVVGIPEAVSGSPRSWQTPGRHGGIWAPPGAVVASNGDLYATTGNTESSAAFDDGNAVVRLSGDLHQRDVFAPANWADLNGSDADLGSVSPTLLPGGLVFQVGKEGVGYLLSASHLGGVGGQLFSAHVCDGAFGGTAVTGARVFVPCTDGLVALDVGPGARFAVAWRHDGGAGSPVVAGGVVWTVDVGGRLWGLDQATGRVRDSAVIGPVTHFPSLAVAGGQLYAETGARIVCYRGV